MKIRCPLYAQTLGILLLHLAVEASLFFLFFNTQFGAGWEALVHSPAGDRLVEIAWLLERQIDNQNQATQEATLQQFDKLYGVTFYIVDALGQQVAGPKVDIPAKVLAQLPPLPPEFRSIHRFRFQLRHPPGLSRSAGVINELPPDGEFGPPPDEKFGPPPPDDLDDHEPPPPPEFGGPHHMFGPEPPRFIVQTSNPTMLWIGVVLPKMPPQHNHGRHSFHNFRFLLASTPNIWQSKLLVNFDLLFLVTGCVLAVSVMIWLPFAYRLTRAVSELTRAAEKIADGNFETRLSSGNWDEIDSLKHAINAMTDRIKNYIMGQRRFLGDIAHELCSPVARLQVATQILKDTSRPESIGTVNDVQEDIEEMRLLINELLAFSKASIQGVDINLVPINLSDMLQKVLAKVDSAHNIKFNVDSTLYALAEPIFLERALANVLRNSVRYAGAFGEIAVLSESTEKTVSLVVQDQGPGVPPESLNMLGQPFFRLEPSRNRQSGGAGLGLAIVKTCIESCGGSFHASNRQPQGLKVEFRLTRVSAPAQAEGEPGMVHELKSSEAPSG